MTQLNERQIIEFIEQEIPDFHQRRLDGLGRLTLTKMLKRKNPYLFKAKNINTAGELIKGVLDAFLSSQEETVFGRFLEDLAIFICSRAYGGRKSSAEGIDLEFEKDSIIHLVSIKSGPNWGNISQIAKMKDNFRKAKRILGANRSATNIVSINGCCYGRTRTEDKGEYLKLCGQRFWEYISGNTELYVEIIEPIGHQARQRNEAFQVEYDKVVNRFTKEFIGQFCSSDGMILWEQVVRHSSSA